MASYPSDPTNSKPPVAGRRAPDGGARRSRARALAFMLFALVAGLTAAWLITRAVAQRATTSPAAATQIAVAAVDLPYATTLRPEMVTFVDWPTAMLPAGHYTDGKLLEGRVVARDVGKGEPLVESRLAEKGKGEGMAAVIPATHRAMTVQVNEVIGVAGFIHPNDLVDVITTMQSRPGGQEIRSRIVLQNIRVMAVGQQMVTTNSQPVKVPVVTLLVTPEESERLALASTQGKVQLTLRAGTDLALVETPGVSPLDLFEGGEPPAAVAAAPKAVLRPKIAHVTARPEPVKAEQEVVEILRGDRFEERKLRGKETP